MSLVLLHNYSEMVYFILLDLKNMNDEACGCTGIGGS